MERPRKANSQGDFLHATFRKTYNPEPKIVNKISTGQLISLPKQMYKIFNQFLLNESRLSVLPEYQLVSDQIKKFNEQLTKWKQNSHQISNIRLTYNFYQNLFGRIKHVNNFSLNTENAIQMLNQIHHWFITQKPKIRGERPKKQKAVLKQYVKNQQEFSQIQYLTQTSIKNREMKPFQIMARTSHKQFFPPKQRLVDYNRKEIAPFRDFEEYDETNMNSNFFSNKKSLGATVSTFKGTKTTFKSKNKSSQPQILQNNTSNININPKKDQDLNEHEVQIKQFNVQVKENQQNVNSQNQKNLIKSGIVNQLIDQPKYQQDEPDEDGSNAIDEQQVQEKYKKAYLSDNFATDIMIAEQKVKEQKQSTLRRILKQKQQKIQQKFEELDLKKNMLQWGKAKSSRLTQENRKLERLNLVNKYKNVQFKKNINPEQTHKNIPQFDIKLRSLTSQGQRKPFQSSIQNNKISKMMKTFGRYIDNHIKVNCFKDENNEDPEIKMMRATSLTNFACQGKKKQFGQVLKNYDVYNFNDDVYEEINNVKDKLAKKMLPLDKKRLYTAMGLVAISQRDKDVNIFPKTSTLFSNPYFPKSKPAKKKKK